MMTVYFFIGYLIVFSIIALVHFTQPNWLKFIEFSLNDPMPIEGEYLSDFKLKKLTFIFNWLLIIFAITASFYCLQTYIRTPYLHHFLLLSSLLSLLISCLAIFANVVFLVSWIRTKYIGPDPICDFKAIEKYYGE
ncbi:hypothetical protein [Marinicellulosiphila megalodicopiae]|uniref:hypothetical protein n=1 Tax=Marinicellulosiphila megalodicopiae TaxID=2724896 RepID=UPI003BB16812